MTNKGHIHAKQNKKSGDQRTPPKKATSETRPDEKGTPEKAAESLGVGSPSQGSYIESAGIEYDSESSELEGNQSPPKSIPEINFGTLEKSKVVIDEPIQEKVDDKPSGSQSKPEAQSMSAMAAAQDVSKKLKESAKPGKVTHKAAGSSKKDVHMDKELDEIFEFLKKGNY